MLSQEGEQSCTVCVSGIDTAFVSTILLLDIGVWYLLGFFLWGWGHFIKHFLNKMAQELKNRNKFFFHYLYPTLNIYKLRHVTHTKGYSLFNTTMTLI